MNRNLLAIFLALLAASASLVGCSTRTAETAPNLAVPVTVAKAEVKTMPLELHAIGTGEAYSTVSIKSQVNAQLQEVHFHQGDFVKKGQLLFTLDKRPFVAAQNQAQANLARDKAQAANAEVEARRYQELLAQGIASREQHDQFQATAMAQEALVHADEAAVETARLNLQYCTISSPIDGKTGSLMAYPGNILKENDVPILVVINQITPLYVDFNVPEQYLGEIKQYMARGKLPVQVFTQDGNLHPEIGTLTFVDNNVDSTTGTIKLKATFSNADRRLWPGQFVNVVLRLAEQADAVVVPSQAVQTGQQGPFVFIIKPDMTAESREVMLSRTIGNETILDKGVRPGETVVTDGQLNLIPGIKVQIRAGLSGK